MSNAGIKQPGPVLLGLAGGMRVVAGGFIGGYYVLGTRAVANAATTPPKSDLATVSAPAIPGENLTAMLGREVELKTASGPRKLSWAALGVEVDPDEAKHATGDLGSLAKR